MTLDLLKFKLDAEPFVAFDLHLADQRSLPVSNVELVSIAEDERSICLFTPLEKTEYIDPGLVVSLTVYDQQP